MNTPLNTPTQILYTVDFKLRNTTQRNAAIRRNINRLCYTECTVTATFGGLFYVKLSQYSITKTTISFICMTITEYYSIAIKALTS